MRMVLFSGLGPDAQNQASCRDCWENTWSIPGEGFFVEVTAGERWRWRSCRKYSDATHIAMVWC